jgi:hypothetical protein
MVSDDTANRQDINFASECGIQQDFIAPPRVMRRNIPLLTRHVEFA